MSWTGRPPSRSAPADLDFSSRSALRKAARIAAVSPGRSALARARRPKIRAKLLRCLDSALEKQAETGGNRTRGSLTISGIRRPPAEWVWHIGSRYVRVRPRVARGEGWSPAHASRRAPVGPRGDANHSSLSWRNPGSVCGRPPSGKGVAARRSGRLRSYVRPCVRLDGRWPRWVLQLSQHCLRAAPDRGRFAER